ncbi:hypothetical protein TNCV_2456061 [Trichonephila clavipes]|nr:hypothetical protein TNCV_2456061 [Trichonephila clavipes]
MRMTSHDRLDPRWALSRSRSTDGPVEAGYKWPESGLSTVESTSNKWYCHQDGQPRSPQRINICIGSLVDLKHMMTEADIDSSACSCLCLEE